MEKSDLIVIVLVIIFLIVLMIFGVRGEEIENKKIDYQTRLLTRQTIAVEQIARTLTALKEE